MQLVCPSCFAVNRAPRERLAEQPVCGKCRARLLQSEPVALDDASFLLRGREVARMSGAVPAPQLLQWLDQSLAGQAAREAT